MDDQVQEKHMDPPRYPSGSTTDVGTPASDPEKDAGARPGTGPRARDFSGDGGGDAESSGHGEVESDEPPAQNIIDRVLSRASTHSVNPGPPPNGGYAGWMAGKSPYPGSRASTDPGPRLTPPQLPVCT